jgi:hypothetical protein
LEKPVGNETSTRSLEPYTSNVSLNSHNSGRSTHVQTARFPSAYSSVVVIPRPSAQISVLITRDGGPNAPWRRVEWQLGASARPNTSMLPPPDARVRWRMIGELPMEYHRSDVP